MTKFLAFIFVAVCFLGVSASAQEITEADKKLVQEAMKNAEPFSKGEIESSIDNLVKQGVISPEQAAQAREELQGMSASDIKQLQNQAADLMAR